LLHALGLDVAVRDLELVVRPADRATAELMSG
jgi:hypothetical protein